MFRLNFASFNEALQYLADLTDRTVRIADNSEYDHAFEYLYHIALHDSKDDAELIVNEGSLKLDDENPEEIDVDNAKVELVLPKGWYFEDDDLVVHVVRDKDSNEVKARKEFYGFDDFLFEKIKKTTSFDELFYLQNVEEHGELKSVSFDVDEIEISTDQRSMTLVLEPEYEWIYTGEEEGF